MRTIPIAACRRARLAASALALVLAAGVALAAPVLPGEIAVHSGVGAPLSVSIDLGAPTEEDLLGLRVELAGQADYAARGVEWVDELATLQTGLRLKRDGRLTFTIASERPIRAQTLRLLVRVVQRDAAPVGRLYVLDAAPPPAALPSTAPAPTSTGTDRPSAAAPADAPPPRPASPAARADRIRVAPGDTALGIADRITPPGATRYQSLAALHRRNAPAFDGSVHRLRSGAELVVPDEVVILATAEAEGHRLAAVPLRAPGTGRAAAGDGAAPPATTGPAGDALRLSRTAPADGRGGRAQARRESMIAIRNATAEARSRIADLEAIEHDLRKLLEIRSVQIAALQREQGITPAAGPGAAGKSVTSAPTAPAAQSAAQSAAQPSAPAGPAAGAPMAPARSPAAPTVKAVLPAPEPETTDWTTLLLDNLAICVAGGALLVAGIAWLVQRRRAGGASKGRKRGAVRDEPSYATTRLGRTTRI